MKTESLGAFVVAALYLFHQCLALAPHSPGFNAVGVSVPMGRRAPRFVPQTSGTTLPSTGGILSLGEYYATIKVGGQNMDVDLDTGSSTLAVPDTVCINCVATTSQPFYNTSKSSAYAGIPCGTSTCNSYYCASNLATVGSISSIQQQCLFNIQYGDGSGLAGASAYDTITIAGVSSTQIAGTAMFGRVINNKNFESASDHKAPGILGLAYSALNSPSGTYCSSCSAPNFPTVLDAIASSTGMRYLFGMCMTASGGVWDVGYGDQNKVNGAVQWINVQQEPSANVYAYWRVALNGITQYNQAITVSSSVRCIVDSGTTFILLNSATFSSLSTLWTSLNLPGASSLLSSGGTATLSAGQVAQWQPIYFNVGGYNFTVPTSAYLINLGGSTYQLGIQSSGTSGDNILGDVFMENFYTLFDHDYNRVGIANLTTGSCDSTKPVNASVYSCPTCSSGSSSSSPLSTMQIALIAGIGGGVLLIGLLGYICCKCCRNSSSEGREDPRERRKQRLAAQNANVQLSQGGRPGTAYANPSPNNSAYMQNSQAYAQQNPQAYGQQNPPDYNANAFMNQSKMYQQQMDLQHQSQPVQWAKHLTSDGRTYYFNSTTGESSWNPPPGFQG